MIGDPSQPRASIAIQIKAPFPIRVVHFKTKESTFGRSLNQGFRHTGPLIWQLRQIFHDPLNRDQFRQ